MEALNTLTQFLSIVKKEINCKEVLESYENNYNLKKYKITEILDTSALSMYKHISEKFYKNHKPGESATWVENQLRLYLWIVICYMEVYRKNLSTLKKQDWDFFASIFYVKQYSLFEYQARTLLDETARMAKWTDQEDFMLYNIIVRDRGAKWNQIAKSLFINSDKKYLRASKQCRQRWLNHLDPSKSKCQWSLKQYLILFEQVLEKGKKWAVLVKVLNDRRSQHSIKNKYNSIIRKQSRLTPQYNQKEVCQQLIKKINKILETRQIQVNDQYLFGCSLKLLNDEDQNKSNKKIIINSAQQIEGYRSRFQNFRKKIQRFSSDQLSTACKYQNLGKESKRNSRQNRQLKQKCNTVIHPLAQIKQNEKKTNLVEAEDQIFYDQSLDGHDIMQPQYNNILFADDLKNFINEHQLDV